MLCCSTGFLLTAALCHAHCSCAVNYFRVFSYTDGFLAKSRLVGYIVVLDGSFVYQESSLS